MRHKTWVMSLTLTAVSVALAAFSVQYGRRVDYLDHLLTFNVLAAAMLGFAAAGLTVAGVSLVGTRGRGRTLWLAALCAVVVLGLYLLDG